MKKCRLNPPELQNSMPATSEFSPAPQIRGNTVFWGGFDSRIGWRQRKLGCQRACDLLTVSSGTSFRAFHSEYFTPVPAPPGKAVSSTKLIGWDCRESTSGAFIGKRRGMRRSYLWKNVCKSLLGWDLWKPLNNRVPEFRRTIPGKIVTGDCE